MAILVTGGAGFIGSHVVDSLLARGDTVICVDDLNNYYSPKQKLDNIKEHKRSKHYRFYKLDIRDKKKLGAVFRKHKITSIIHLAARAGVRSSLADPKLYITTNVLGTLNLLELAKQYKVKNFVYASSSSVYGNCKQVPFTEGMKLDEQISPYAASKKAAENLCYVYSSLYNTPVTCLRFFTVYGPRGRPDMAPYLFLDAVHNGKPITVFGDGSTSRDYTYIADIVSGVLASHDSPVRFEVYNLGNNNPVSLKEFISTVEAVTGKKAIINRKPLQPGDVERTYASIDKAKRALNYNPRTSLRKGLQATYDWYRRKE